MDNMREKYESLSVAALKDLAKARGLKSLSGLKKAEVVEAMLAEDQRLKQIKKREDEAAQAKEKVKKEHNTQTEQGAAEHTEKNTDKNADRNTDRNADQGEMPNANLDSGITANGILEVMQEGYGFIRCANYLPGENDVYVSPSQIRRFRLKTGDIVCGNTRIKTQSEKFSALLYITTINGYPPSVAGKRKNFEDLTPIFPNERLRLETDRGGLAMRIVVRVSVV